MGVIGVVGVRIRRRVAVIVAMAVAVRVLVFTFAAPVFSVCIAMLMSMPPMPMSTAFPLFVTVCFGFAEVMHWWLPGSICGLVNTLKPLQGQGRYPEGS
ncbi:hypothetical protein CIC12_09385 [Burkholderia sp. SG-MS1]|nr:hypothetical protein [Paraburkholderia sp. SG-MS1]